MLPKHYFGLLALTIALSCGYARAEEPPLVGTVVFKTSPHSDKLDINTASRRQLSALPGMALYADKIIAGRPYATKLDLLKRGIVPQSAYDKVKTRLIAHRVRAQKPKTQKSVLPHGSTR